MTTERVFEWRCMQAIARFLATVLFDLKIEGHHHIPEQGGALIVSNHQGYLDPIVLGVAMHRPLNFIAKSELFENWYAGQFLRSLNAFPIRQGAGDVDAVKEMIHRLQEGHLLNIFPEGSRTEDGEIATLQKGVALVIHRAKVPVVPAVIAGSYQAWPIWRKYPQRHPIRVEFGPPMELADLKTDEIMAALDHTLRAMFAQLRARYAGEFELRAKRQ